MLNAMGSYWKAPSPWTKSNLCCEAQSRCRPQVEAISWRQRKGQDFSSNSATANGQAGGGGEEQTSTL